MFSSLIVVDKGLTNGCFRCHSLFICVRICLPVPSYPSPRMNRVDKPQEVVVFLDVVDAVLCEN